MTSTTLGAGSPFFALWTRGLARRHALGIRNPALLPESGDHEPEPSSAR